MQMYKTINSEKEFVGYIEQLLNGFEMDALYVYNLIQQGELEKYLARNFYSFSNYNVFREIFNLDTKFQQTTDNKIVDIDLVHNVIKFNKDINFKRRIKPEIYLNGALVLDTLNLGFNILTGCYNVSSKTYKKLFKPESLETVLILTFYDQLIGRHVYLPISSETYNISYDDEYIDVEITINKGDIVQPDKEYLHILRNFDVTTDTIVREFELVFSSEYRESYNPELFAHSIIYKVDSIFNLRRAKNFTSEFLNQYTPSRSMKFEIISQSLHFTSILIQKTFNKFTMKRLLLIHHVPEKI